MRLLGVPLVLIVLSFCTSLAAQHSGGGGAGGSHPGGGGTSVGNTPSTGFPNGNVPALNPSSNEVLFFLSGKVVVDDGTALPDAATLQTNCKGQRRTIGLTDSRGFFSFQLGGTQPEKYLTGDVTDSPTSAAGNAQWSRVVDWSNCELQALAPGFTSQVVELGSRLNGDSVVNIGSIMLHRMAQVQGFTVSATSAAAPRKARKDYTRGLSLENKGAWGPAQNRFQSAVDLYPRYAAAWVELGRMQMKHDHESEARYSFQKALAADSRFLPPYQQLIAIAVTQKKWQDLADSTGQVLNLDPVSFPQYWFFNAAANYNLRKFDVAEKSATRGLEADVGHRLPILEYLLGLTLARKHDYHGAVQHLRNYLRLAPEDPRARVAQDQLKQLEALEDTARAANPE